MNRIDNIIKETIKKALKEEDFQNAKYSISPKGSEFKRRLKRGYGFKKKLQERKMINEGESYGWIVEPEEAQEAYNFALEYLGEEELNKAIVRCLTDSALSDCLTFIFRMYEFNEWYERNDS